MIDTKTIEQLKEATSLTEIFKQYGHKIIEQGSAKKTLCPFHQEKTPSLSINESKKLWNCFGCGESGDVFGFIQKKENLSFPDAVEKLSQLKNVSSSTVPSVQTVQPKQNTSLLTKVCDHYHNQLFELEEGRSYLESRGLVQERVWRDYAIGYCDGSLLKTFPDLKEQLKESGVVLKNGRERFFNCVVFPIQNEAGEVVSIYGRHLQKGHFYMPGPRLGLFNGQALLASSPTQIILTESIIDALSFIEHGITNVLPLYGTNGFTESHFSLLKTLSPKEIIIALDSDEEGCRAAQLLKKKLNRYTSSIVTFPKETDANTYFLSHSKDDFFRLLPSQTTQPSTDLTRKYQMKYVEQKGSRLAVTIRSENEATGKFNLDTYNLYSQKQRQQLISDTVSLFDEDEKKIEKEVNVLIGLAEKKANSGSGKDDNAAEEESVMSKQDEKTALSFLTAPNLFDLVKSDYDSLGYIGEETNKVLAYLVMTSRKMANPLSLIIMSNSAAGKSSLQKATMDFCPDEDGKHFTRLTQQSLYYLGEDSIKHKCLSIEEEEGSSEASYSLKTLLSAKVLNVATTTQDPQTGKKKAEEYKTEGPVSVMVSTTSPEIEPEFESRTLVISVDESRKQTSSIQSQQKQSRTLNGQTICANHEAIKQKHHNAQRLLESGLVIVNNYAPQLTFPSQRLRFRRTHAHYLDLIDTVAFLRQKQKVVTEHSGLGRYIEVEKEDIRFANAIFIQVMGQSLNELKSTTAEVLQKLIDFSEEHGRVIFQRREIREYGNYTNSHLHRQLNVLEELEYITSISGTNGSKYTYKLLYDKTISLDNQFIPSIKPADELTDV
jgi:DNA primase